MSVTIASFRLNFPEFTSETTYPDTVVTFWLGITANFVDLVKWGTMADYGTQLALAHFLTLAPQTGGVPGSSPGLVNSESAGDLSAGYDTQATAEAGGASWNESSYGRLYLKVAKIIGGVARQL